jgi:hypothetical protein
MIGVGVRPTQVVPRESLKKKQGAGRQNGSKLVPVFADVSHEDADGPVTPTA